MWSSYIKLAIRQLWKNKFYSSINILGLTIGLASCLLIVFYVLDELSYDQFHKNKDRIYRITVEFKTGEGLPPRHSGIFGLASFSASQKTKEIGIRKVLGASVQHISLLLTKEFIKLVILANIIAWPVAWYIMQRWLQDFPYRIEIKGWMFIIAAIIAAIIAVFIAIITVSAQAIKAAIANPIVALRSE